MTYTNETSLRLVADASVSTADPEEKDYAWDDVDNDGDVDLVVVRKQPVTTAGGRRNVLLMNENGVLTDRTDDFAPEMLDATNDRDVILVDVNLDGWVDMVTAAACNGCNSASFVDDSRLYLNLGDPGGDGWDGFDTPIVLFGGGNNFCAVAGGDVDGDEYPDLYFVSYNDSFEDQLMINGGAANPGVFTVENGRLTLSMRQSSFGSHAVIVDMDNDGDNDIVKSENGPVEMFRNDGTGNFDMLDPTYSAAAYHVGVGELNNDGLMDLIISDDGIDRRIMNDGALFDSAPDSSLTFPSETNGFGSNSLVVDLDLDGWNDVIIADVDVDIAGCDRISDILRNNGGASFTHDSGNLPQSQLNGVHDVAVFDIDGDTFPDIVMGRCNSTQVWINSPPIAIAFSYPGGLPDFVGPNQTTEFDVMLEPIGDTIEPGSESIFVSVNGGAFTESALTEVGEGLYTAALPAGECTDRLDFYVSASMSGGLSFTDPAAAPAQTYTAVAAEGTETVFVDDIEGDVSDWTIESDPSLTSGEWEQADPNLTVFNSLVAAPGDDATPDGTMAFVTENGPSGDSNAASYDVDGGPTQLLSPIVDLADNDGFISFNLWTFSAVGIHDVLIVEVSNDGGGSWTHVETVTDTGSAWAPLSFFVSDFVTPTDQVQVRFTISDNPNDSVTEGGVDDFTVEALTCGDACPWDVSGDGEVGITDFLGLLAAWGPCPPDPDPCPYDFNGDGEVGVTDFLELLGVWGPCP